MKANLFSLLHLLQKGADTPASRSSLGDEHVDERGDVHRLEGLLVGDGVDDPARGQGVSSRTSKESVSEDALLDVGGVKVGGDVALELSVEERGSLIATTLVSDGVVDVDLRRRGDVSDVCWVSARQKAHLVHDGTVFESDGEGVSDEALLGVVVCERGGQLRSDDVSVDTHTQQSLKKSKVSGVQAMSTGKNRRTKFLTPHR